MMSSTNPFSHLTSTIHVFPSSDSFLDHEKDDLYINYPHASYPFLSGDWFPAWEKETTIKQNLGLEQCEEYADHLFWSEVKNNKASNKDHHSKIHTAHGPRDRRVRLSIEVAKRFFYLQDLLGFDKASKTLDWLFNKSKISIDELIKRKKESSSSTLTNQSEVVFQETGSDEQAKRRRKKKCDDDGKRKKMTRSGFSNVNQSRADARARARVRTIEKLNIKKLDHNYKESKNNVHIVDSCSSNLTLDSRFWNSVQEQNDYSDRTVESVTEDKISMLYNSYPHNLDVLNGLPKFTDVHDEQSGDYASFRSVEGPDPHP